jgi:predicted AAA+ superfamily ATPase
LGPGRGCQGAEREKTGAWAVRQLQPWFENIGKRQVRSPKVYVRDAGLLHALLDLQTHEQLTGQPKVGASFEGFVVEQVVNLLHVRDAYFWGAHQGAEDAQIAYSKLARAISPQ